MTASLNKSASEQPARNAAFGTRIHARGRYIDNQSMTVGFTFQNNPQCITSSYLQCKHCSLIFKQALKVWLTDKTGKREQANESLLLSGFFLFLFFSLPPTRNMKRGSGTEQSAAACIINASMMQ